VLYIHNGVHPHSGDGYFEWWYLHLLTNEGWFVNFIVHATDIFSADRTSYISMSLLSPEGQPYYFRRTLGVPLEAFDSKSLWIRLAGCSLSESASEIEIHLAFDDASLTCTIHKQCDSFVVEDGVLFSDRSTGLSNHWFVPVPHAPFTAEVRLFSQVIGLSGFAYHDHNWGNARILYCPRTCQTLNIRHGEPFWPIQCVSLCR